MISALSYSKTPSIYASSMDGAVGVTLFVVGILGVAGLSPAGQWGLITAGISYGIFTVVITLLSTHLHKKLSDEVQKSGRLNTQCIEQSKVLERLDTQCTEQSKVLERLNTQCTEQSKVLERLDTQCTEQSKALERLNTQCTEQKDARWRVECELRETKTQYAAQAEKLAKSEKKLAESAESQILLRGDIKTLGGDSNGSSNGFVGWLFGLFSGEQSSPPPKVVEEVSEVPLPPTNGYPPLTYYSGPAAIMAALQHANGKTKSQLEKERLTEILAQHFSGERKTVN